MAKPKPVMLIQVGVLT